MAPWDDPPAVWVGREQELKLNILKLSQNAHYFRSKLPPPPNQQTPTSTNMSFLDANPKYKQMALAALQLDPHLSQVRYQLVPAILTEDVYVVCCFV